MSGRLFPTRGVPGAGGGADTYWRVPAVRRASAAQVKGLYPWVAGTGSKLGTGAPMGPVLRKTPGPAAILCADPISWFERGGLISNPSAVVMGGPGHGKSTLIRRQILALAHQGVLSWVLGDVKREYVTLIAGLGGQVISLGRGGGALNVLDLGDAPAAAARLKATSHRTEADALLAEAKARRQLGVEALITVQRGQPPVELECLVLAVALDLLDSAWRRRKGAPLVSDLLALVDNAPDELKDVALARGELSKYYAATDSLRTSLAGLSSSAGLGAVFNRPTSVPLDRHRPLVFDVSGIDKGERKLRAAALLSCWTAGFGAIAVSNVMEDAGLELARRKFLVTDELWSVLQEGTGLVDRYNGLSRLNRTEGVGTITAFHSSADLAALESEADRAKAGGLIERAGMVFCAGMPRSEVTRLRAVTHFTRREEDEVAGWSAPPTLQTTGRRRRPPGQGNFLLKAGDGADTPGVAFHLRLTRTELAGLNNTDQRWDVA
ncbi:ATP/GTP-binding protein [Nakamurella sp. GG22]